MVNQNYVGRGRNLEEAIKNLYETAKQNEVTSEPTRVEYNCSINRVRGKTNKDYGAAFNSAFKRANLTAESYASKMLEVEAIGTFRIAKKKQPKPSGSAEKGLHSLDLTELF